MSSESIGRVSANERTPSSCDQVSFWVAEGVVIRPFDVVRITHVQGSHSYAIVQELKYVSDSSGHLASFVSHDFGDPSTRPRNERLGATIAQAEVLYNTLGIEMPLKDGMSVEWADEEGIQRALGFGDFTTPIPAGYLHMSNGTEVSVEFNAPYLLGPEGAHLNIAGMSGLATKTSYAMFLLNSIQQRMGDGVTFIILNVKGTDLLAIDVPREPGSDAEVEENRKRAWECCGLKPEPFENVKYLYPYSGDAERMYTQSHVAQVAPEILRTQVSEGRASNYHYDVQTGLPKLPLFFSDIDDPNSTLESIAHDLPQMVESESWHDLRTEVRSLGKSKSGKAGDIHPMSWRRFSRLLRTRTASNSIFTEKAYSEPEERRQVLVRKALAELSKGDVLVIDIEPLPDYLQCLVFGDVVNTIWSSKLGEDPDIEPDVFGKVVVFADELNKYAPRTSGSGRTLTKNLLEITERGRSLGMVLFGAEQFRSGVHDRVLGNCSTNVFGRTSPVETAKCPDYRYFPGSMKSGVVRLAQGKLLLQHSAFKTALIQVSFPYPCYHQPKSR